MSKALELREKRAKAWDAAKAFLESKQGKDGLVSAEDAATYDKMEQDVLALGKEIERLDRQAALDAEMSKATSNPITNAPTSPSEAKTGRASDEYRKDFINALRGAPLVSNVLSTSPDADGGYLIPEILESQLVTKLSEENVVRSLAKVITTGAERKINIGVNSPVAQWTAENAAVTESSPTFMQKTIDAYKLTCLVKVSLELLQDSMFDIEEYLMAEFARAFGIAEEEAFCIGTGTGRPSGIFTANGGEVGKQATSATAITLDDLIELIYSLKAPYRRNAAFLMRDVTVSALRKLKDSNGAYLWQPSIQAGEPDRLLGYPLYTSPYVPVVEANALTIGFGDFSNYWIADRLGRTVQRLNELFAGNGQIGFIGVQRVDGKVILTEGIKLLKMAGS